MKNLFKNKNFYLGLAAAFAIVTGIYLTVPTGIGASDAHQVQTTDNKSVDTEVDSAINVKELKVPATNIQHNDGGKQDLDNTNVPTNEPTPGQI